MQQIIYAVCREGCTGQTVDLVLGPWALRIDVAFDYLHRQVVAVIEQLLARPQTTPLRIINFTTETGSLSVLVEAEAGNGIQITLHRHEAIKRRPQTVA